MNAVGTSEGNSVEKCSNYCSGHAWSDQGRGNVELFIVLYIALVVLYT